MKALEEIREEMRECELPPISWYKYIILVPRNGV